MRTSWQPVASQPIPEPRDGHHHRPGSRRHAFLGPEVAPDWLGLVFCRRHPWELRLRVVGEVDLLTAPQLARALRSAVRTLCAEQPSDEPPRVVCDLDDVTFFGATGVHVLVQADLDATDHQVDLAIVAADGPARRCLALTLMDRHLTMAERDRATFS